jgi:hypothetical protein
MKKIYLIFIISFFFGLNANANYNNDYNSYIQLDYNQDFETICYSNYYYNNRFYKLYMPCTRDEFIRLEFAVATGELTNKNNYWFKLVWLNALLINK